MKILSARHIGSANKQGDYPKDKLKEIAFAGRSNVGKSSVINTLLGRRNLASISKTPGHTRKLNFYLVNDHIVLVDLPGYGFARVPIKVKMEWGRVVETYLGGRDQLAGVVLIVDSRRDPQESDRVMMEYLEHYRIPCVVVATKVDKLSKNQANRQARIIMEDLDDSFPLILFSSLKGQGKKELWKEIKSLIE
ncbi:ribosome biogenesis GTP-binding protein YihA/YsxC [Thermodesulfobacteriota bacterium]